MRSQRWFFITLFLVILTALAVDGLDYQLTLIHDRGLRIAEQDSKRLADLFAKHLQEGSDLSSDLLKEWLTLDGQLAYILLDSSIDGVKVGEFNSRAVHQLPIDLQTYLINTSKDQQFDKLLLPEAGGAQSGFLVLDVELRDQMFPKSQPRALVKMGYILPDYYFWSQLSKQTQLLALASSLACSLMLIVWLRSLTKKDKRPRASTKVKRPPVEDKSPEEIDLLSLPIDKDKTEIVSLTQPKHLGHENWISMYKPQEGLKSWQLRGGWYVISDFIMASPWLASLVRPDLKFRNYIYRVKAKKISGPDGFVALFTCDDKNLVWVLGGWNNSYSELAGVASTRRENVIKEGQWYDLTIEVLSDGLHGYLDGDRMWSVARHDFISEDFSKEFLPGIGVGTWSCICKFKDPVIVDKSEDTVSEKVPHA